MSYRQIVFLQGEDYDTDGFSDMGIKEQVDYMLQWDEGEGVLSDESPCGTEDHVYIVVRGDVAYELNINYRVGYAGLSEVI